MPCNGGPHPYQEGHSSCNETIDRLTQLLCYMCGRANDKRDYATLPEQIQTWFDSHVKRDTRRLEESFEREKGDYYNAVSQATARIKESEEAHPVSNFAKQLIYAAADNVWRIFDNDIVAARVSGLAKLTSEERKALGLEEGK